VPPELWKAMVAAQRVAIVAPRAARAEYLTRAYADVVADAGRLAGVIDLLRMSCSQDQVEGWRQMAGTGQFADLADSLMLHHYDPRYDKHRARMAAGMVEVRAARLDDGDLPGLALAVAAKVGRIAG